MLFQHVTGNIVEDAAYAFVVSNLLMVWIDPLEVEIFGRGDNVVADQIITCRVGLN